ncbi:flagellar export protein FliJ [Bartonella sp. WD16.2]|uniref:flagellar export protein FliJ n=1 Tax=Bartonella sp. WD16.2 TaxID=1933904 RepID=UPI0009999952|nr:flagellar export protein FliJ [Bartonella sp. WD16.2]AQX20093.1 hypothetical protein BWD162_009840 [Bartonella sp. WD16.2]
MKSQQSMVRLKMFQVREKRREIAQLEIMIKEFEQMTLELEAQIASEERKSGNNDIHHFAYSTVACAARKRHDNLTDSIRNLQLQKANAEIILHEIETELRRIQILEMRENKKAVGE